MQEKKPARAAASAAKSPAARMPRAKRSPAKHPPLHDVVGALYAEHRYVERLLALLEALVDAASRGQALDRGAALGVMQYMTSNPDCYHHPREDAMFARLVKRDPGSASRIAEMQRAHRTIGAAGKRLLAALQRLDRNAHGDEAGVVSRMRDYAGAMREHMTIEERDLFPRASALLDDDDLEKIDRAFARATDPLFEAQLRDAYAAYSPLVRYLVEQPAVRHAFDLLEAVYASAGTLGEMIFGAGAAAAAPDRLADAAPASRVDSRARRRTPPSPARRIRSRPGTP
jgi:hemerythrin-like domain-containing protein